MKEYTVEDRLRNLAKSIQRAQNARVLEDSYDAAVKDIRMLRAALDDCAQWMDGREKHVPGLERLTDWARHVLAVTAR